MKIEIREEGKVDDEEIRKGEIQRRGVREKR